LSEDLTCMECGVKNGNGAEVVAIFKFWSCGGRGCGHFEWRKFEGENKPLCQECESKLFFCCDECGTFIDNDCLFGMEEFNEGGEYIGRKCPGCEKIIIHD
jgi:hypothetical protein